MFKPTPRYLMAVADCLAAEGCPSIATGLYERTVWHGLG
jgi:hypothetical protein